MSIWCNIWGNLINLSSELTSCGHWWLAEVNECYVYVTLFCWCLSVVETLIEQLHEAWDIQTCLFTLKLVVQKKEWWRSFTLRSHAGTGADRGRSSQCLCWVYTARFWTVQRLSKAFIQRSVMPHQRQSKHHLLFDHPEEKTKTILYSFGTHA